MIRFPVSTFRCRGDVRAPQLFAFEFEGACYAFRLVDAGVDEEPQLG